MKTAVLMKRDLNGLPVKQNSKTGMFNANDLLDIFNSTAKKKKRIGTYLENLSTQEYIQTIARDQNSNDRNSCDLESTVIQTLRGRVNGGTWMHPYLFIDFAMWLSPEFKLTCVKWIYDKLIIFRNDSGDSFKEIGAALKELNLVRPHYYIDEAHLLNKLVFGDPEGGQRNMATESQLKLMDTLQKADVKLIKEGRNIMQREASLIRLKHLLS